MLINCVYGRTKYEHVLKRLHIFLMTSKGKYTALIAVLVVGSFIIPMAQYFWYVKDDDSSDKFFAKAAEPEPEPPKKKGGGWFGGGKV